jgi:hypothetical protein
VLAGAVAVGAVVTAAILATRSSGTAAPDDAAIAHSDDNDPPDPDPRVPTPSDPWAPTPGPSPTPNPPNPPPTPPRVDPWAQSDTSSGSKVDVGQGVSLLLPPEFQTRKRQGKTVAYDHRGITIVAEPIPTRSNDPEELAEAHAEAHEELDLELDDTTTVDIAGTKRPLAVFRGNYGRVALRHVAVALIGRRYRLMVSFQVPASIADEPAIQTLATELYERRIVLP